jgi:uncharacterized membrane protein
MKGVYDYALYQSSKLNQELVREILHRFRIQSHLEALRNYLLLRQGDFVQLLMDLLRFVMVWISIFVFISLLVRIWIVLPRHCIGTI